MSGFEEVMDALTSKKHSQLAGRGSSAQFAAGYLKSAQLPGSTKLVQSLLKYL